MNKRSLKIERTLIAMLLMFVLSFGTVYAAEEEATDGSKEGAKLVLLADEDNAKTPAKNSSNIIKKGKYYYYKDPKTGKIRKEKGFVRDNGKLYYIGSRKGRIVTDKAFKVKKKYYHARKDGRIATGVYKWHKKLYYSNPKTGRWIKKECIVTWKDKKYYIQKGGVIRTDDVFVYEQMPYKADDDGKLELLKVPDTDNPVIEVARKQVGIMTGKKYWKWYFHTKFVNTDVTPWCGAFVAWCFNRAGEYDRVTQIKNYGNLGYVPSYSSYADKKGKWVKVKKAKAGDILIYRGSIHVGLVEGVVDGQIVSIEGNAGPTAYIRGMPGAVVRRVCPVNSWKIKGVIRVF